MSLARVLHRWWFGLKIRHPVLRGRQGLRYHQWAMARLRAAQNHALHHEMPLGDAIEDLYGDKP
jgi:hypothetical protein